MPRARPPALGRSAVALVAAAALAAGCTDRGDDITSPPDPASPPPFASAASCGACHPRHFADWKLSMHAYAGVDPVMRRMAEMADAESGPGRALGGDDCRRCHDPSVERQRQWLEALPPGASPLVEDVSLDGISCDVCHSVQIVPPIGDIAYLDEVDPSVGPKLGGIADPVPNPVHESARDFSYVTSINCAPCHQVNLPDGSGLENTWTEWSDSILSGFGIECQSCHMPAETGPAAVGGPDRTVHRHLFTGVDMALEPFRGIDRDAQRDLVAALLRDAVTVTSVVPDDAVPGAALDLEITVRNDRTGHSIPSGTSFARDMWIEVTVTDATDAVLYRSGALGPDGEVVEDVGLARFESIAYDAQGQRTFLLWRIASIDETGLLRHGESRTHGWSIDVPPGAAGPLRVELALRFRAMRPRILRAIDLESLLPLEVFPMWEESHTVALAAPR